MIRFPVLILAGLLSMPLMEVFSMLWFRVAPANLDLTANYFLMVVLPAALVLHFLMALLLWKAFEPSPKTGGAVYLACDPVASSCTNPGRWIQGLFIGALVVLIRVTNPTHPDAVIVVILLASILAPLIDYAVISVNIRARARRHV